VVIEEELRKRNITWKKCAVVGDDLTDLESFKRASISIAFCAKDKQLKDYATYIIDEKDLRRVLPIFLSLL
jgi:phosphoserine phosphatase